MPARTRSVERFKGFLSLRGLSIKGVELEEVDVIGAEAFEGDFDGSDEIEISRGADIIGAGAVTEGGFGGDEDFVPAAFDGVAEDFLGCAGGVNIGGIKHGEAGFETNVHHAAGLGDVGGAEAFEGFGIAAEGAGAEAEEGDFEAGVAE